MEKIENVENKMETLIFLSKDPLTVEELAKFYGLSLDETQEILLMLKEKRKESGIPMSKPWQSLLIKVLLLKGKLNR